MAARLAWWVVNTATRDQGLTPNDHKPKFPKLVPIARGFHDGQNYYYLFLLKKKLPFKLIYLVPSLLSYLVPSLYYTIIFYENISTNSPLIILLFILIPLILKHPNNNRRSRGVVEIDKGERLEPAMPGIIH
ncbi:MAG: hypothetical protein GY928_19615 [Colwellia sp.]|nr:hypothetical protein [Colwellia sp.]